MVSAEKIMQELHIDESPEEIELIGSLIEQAKTIILHSITSNPDIDELFVEKINRDVFERLTITLVTQFYYDRELSKGYSTGFMIMIEQLKTDVLMGYENAKRKKVIQP